MQHVTGYLLTLQYFDFNVPLEYVNGQLRQKGNTSSNDIDVTRGKMLPIFIMSSLLLSKTDVGLKLFLAHNVKYDNSVTLRRTYDSFGQYMPIFRKTRTLVSSF